MDLKITQSDVHGAAQESEMDSLKYTLTKKFVNLLDYQSTILTQEEIESGYNDFSSTTMNRMLERKVIQETYGHCGSVYDGTDRVSSYSVSSTMPIRNRFPQNGFVRNREENKGGICDGPSARVTRCLLQKDEDRGAVCSSNSAISNRNYFSSNGRAVNAEKDRSDTHGARPTTRIFNNRRTQSEKLPTIQDSDEDTDDSSVYNVQTIKQNRNIKGTNVGTVKKDTNGHIGMNHKVSSSSSVQRNARNTLNKNTKPLTSINNESIATRTRNAKARKQNPERIVDNRNRVDENAKDIIPDKKPRNKKETGLPFMPRSDTAVSFVASTPLVASSSCRSKKTVNKPVKHCVTSKHTEVKRPLIQNTVENHSELETEFNDSDIDDLRVF